MKKIFLHILITFPFIALSQELNDAFLESLPNELREDIQNRIETKTSNEEPTYRSIQNQTKLEKKRLEDLEKRLEEDLKYLKEKLEEDEDKIDKRFDLKIFGVDFFRTYQSTYMPINEPNLSPSYILDFGDILEIQLVGQENEVQDYQIKRDGSINIPDVGPIKLSGLSMSEASELIKAKVNLTYVGTKTFVSLSNLRDINVLVSGNAYNPGIYTVSGNSNILHVVGIAGGINENGSFREIQLIRNQQVIETLDMYDVLITGKFNTKNTLKSGDVIFVKPVNKIVSIDGAVKVPAKYELIDGQNLYDLIDYANGISNDADLDNIYLDRILDGKIKSLPITNLKQFKDITANDGDTIYIRKHNFKTVNIQGAVLKPGLYLMADNQSINELISNAGGFTDNAYPFGAVYENQEAFQTNKMAKEKLYEEFIDNIITASQKNPVGSYNLSSIVELTQNLKDTVPNGRVVIDLLDEDASDRLIIKDGDVLTIPEKSNHIYIYGEVNYEGALKYNEYADIEYFINKSGGLKDNADSKAIYILHPNGDTQRASVAKNIFQSSPDEALKLYPGSIIFVPRAIDSSATNRLAAQAYVSILGNIGIALASLSSINNN